MERLRGPINMDLAQIPVIVVSGRDLRGNKDRALKAGAKAFLQKPWDDEELLSVTGRLLGRPDEYSEFESIPGWDANETSTP